MLESVVAPGGVVPARWRLEIHNALLTARRRTRCNDDDLREILDDVASLPLRVDATVPELADGSDLAFARRYELSAYDAAYLEIAWRSRLPLMTRDLRLAGAARDLDLLWSPGSVEYA